MESVYLETTIPSYLTAWPARNLVAAAHQAITREWWDLRRDSFTLFVSDLVRQECAAADADAARARLETIANVPELPWSDSIEKIATGLTKLGLVPQRAAADALHVGYAVAHEIDYLLTWNCRHLANAERWPKIESFLRENGYQVPRVCTPEELMGDLDGVESKSF